MFTKLTTQSVSILGDDISVACIYSVRASEEDYKAGYPAVETKVLQPENTVFSENLELQSYVYGIERYCEKYTEIAK